MVWEAEDGHDHWHVKHAARYSLWSADRAAMVAPAMKVGFCLIDSQQRRLARARRGGLHARRANNFCAPGQAPSAKPGGGHLGRAGVTSIVRTLAFQWVDVSDVQPGTYWLRARGRSRQLGAREQRIERPAPMPHESFDDPGLRRPRRSTRGIISATAPTHRPACHEHVREQPRRTRVPHHRAPAPRHG